ncbi:murein DD-endopeptidase MepM [Tatumella citrea]|uniref:Murein DD-endopeptidase MepM n=1 Tax=Tatumella citrea TaxID=53336 RepID=A0A1Y0L838_TATCI|nr:murein DD-endopeptidase MepM [Tatumella citrea]ARU94206.1 murein DD-endopeptidase MepM [Tatumella citrea]ARU98246.1 murein DD-endopeptidase MepM [Tatumella citrea]
MQQIARSVALAFNNLPRPHRIILGSLSVITLAVAVWRPPFYPHGDASESIVRNIETDTEQLSHILPEASEPLDQNNSAADEEDVPPDDTPDSDTPTGRDYTVSSGDTLSSILNQYGIDLTDINALVSSDKALRNVNVGQSLSWTLNADGQLQTLSWEISRRETRDYQRTAQGGFTMTPTIQKGIWQDSVLRGSVQGSFSQSAQRAGLSAAEASAVIKALQWQMDFRKLRAGDKFSVLMSRENLDGKTMQSQLLGVRLRSSGKDYYAFRADDGKFYDRSGSGLSRGFLRFPTVKQYRVSSNFNPRRLNPVTGRIAPHRGVDFALPVGTPVLAVGDGEVITAKNGGAAGNYVALRHGRQYMTRYMHLSRVLVKPGQKVKRGDRIALSGNTGRSTGPHLHFEIWINNQAVNPLTAQMPRMEGLNGGARKQYLADVKGWQKQLTL